MMKRDTILIVDDMEVNRAILHGVFETQYNLLEAENGEQALLLLEDCRSAAGPDDAGYERVSGDGGDAGTGGIHRCSGGGDHGGGFGGTRGQGL